MDEEFLKELVARCRGLAEKADRFTRLRLLGLASRYEAILQKRRADVVINEEPKPSGNP